MSSPNTDVEKQAKRHRGPLYGIVFVLIVAAAAALFFTGDNTLDENDATSGAVATQ